MDGCPGSTSQAVPHLHWFHAGADEDLDSLRDRARSLPRPRGWCASRSYAFPHAVVAHWRQPVGVDVDIPGEADPGPGVFARSIASPVELLALDRVLAASGGAVGLWSSKEALTKALGNPLAHEPRRIDSPATWPLDPADGTRRQCGRWRGTKPSSPAGTVAWLVWQA